MLAAAGNNGATGNAPVYPAAYPEAIAVGAFDESLHRAPFSNTGSYVDVSAPGTPFASPDGPDLRLLAEATRKRRAQPRGA